MANFQSTNTQNLLCVEIIKFTCSFLRVFTKDQGKLWVHTISISYYLNYLMYIGLGDFSHQSITKVL